MIEPPRLLPSRSAGIVRAAQVEAAMTMLRVTRFLSWFLFALFAATAAAQKQPEIRYVSPDKFERATTTDAKGLLQWAEWKPEKCQSCAGSGKTKCLTCWRFKEDAKFCVECKRNKDLETACRACAGLGKWPDPLEKVHCPECFAAGFVLCLTCGGGGQIKTEGGGDRWAACSVCRGDGGFKCSTCNGARLVEVAAVKPNLKDASAATLQKAIAQTDQAIAAIAAVKPTGKGTRKEVKELVKGYGIAQSTFPPLKRTAKSLEDVIGKVYGDNFQGSEEREANTLATFQQHTDYFLKHQKRMLELAHKRAEANEKLLAEQKANKGK